MNVLSPLPANTVTLLRSGQVITSVSCVVKELVENSLDAGATNIEVKLEDYGLDCVEIKDNGLGVSKNEIRLMTAPHCTSKISSFEDLVTEKLQSYGFRGEALNALCSISDLEITTKTSKDLTGTFATFDKSGNPVKELSLATNVGTTIRANKIFSNVPVRRNFYCNSKARKEEDFRKVKQLVTSYGLICPSLRIVLTHNKKEIFRKLSCKTFQECAVQVFGPEIYNSLQNIELKLEVKENMTIDLLVAKNEPVSIKNASRSNSERIFCFVNDRPVVDKLLEKILKKSFPSDRHPVAVVRIRIPPESVDVNLEPSKQTVLIRSKKEIDLTVENALSMHFDKQAAPATSHDAEKVSPFGQNEDSSKKLSDSCFTESSFEESNHFDPASNIKVSTNGHNNTDKIQFFERGNEVLPKNIKQDSFVDSNSKENNQINVATSSKVSTNDITSIENVIRTRFDVTVPAKLCDITPPFDTNERQFMKASDFVRFAPKSHQLRIPEEGPLSNISEPKRPKLDDLGQPKLNFFWKDSPASKTNSGSETRHEPDHKFRNDLNTELEQNSGRTCPDGAVHNVRLNICPENNSDVNDSELIDATLTDKRPRSWARGNCLDDTQGNLMEPVSMGHPKMTSHPAKTASEEFEEGDFILVKRAAHQVQLSPKRPTKRVRKESDTSKNALNQSIKKFYAPKNKTDGEEVQLKPPATKPKVVRQTSNIDFNFDLLTSNEKLHKSHNKKPFQLLGQLSASGLWLFIDHKNESLQLLNHHRLMEVTFFNRLMKSHSLTSAPLLRGPVELFADPCWDSNLTETLLELAGDRAQTCVEVTDQRFVINGITIQVRPVTGRALLTGVANAVNFMGVEDVAEILREIKKDPSVPVEGCRPLKIKNHLMGEAVRLMRQAPCQLDMSSIEKLISFRTKKNIEQCLHYKPITANLIKLSDIPD